MAIVESHVSPDGLLRLSVDLSNGDWTVGFAKGARFDWHTHGDLLAGEYGTSPEAAVRVFVDQVLHSQRTIAISRVQGVVRFAWVTDRTLEEEMEFARPGEVVEFRRWDNARA